MNFDQIWSIFGSQNPPPDTLPELEDLIPPGPPWKKIIPYPCLNPLLKPKALESKSCTSYWAKYCLMWAAEKISYLNRKNLFNFLSLSKEVFIFKREQQIHNNLHNNCISEHNSTARYKIWLKHIHIILHVYICGRNANH